MNKLDQFLTDYFENYAQMAVDNDYYGSCIDDFLCYYSSNIKRGLIDYIGDNFEVRRHIIKEIADKVFDDLMPEDYNDVSIGHTFSFTSELDITFPIEEIEVQIPDEFKNMESEEFHVSGDCAYCTTDEIIIFSIDTDTLDGYINDAIEDLEDFE